MDAMCGPQSQPSSLQDMEHTQIPNLIEWARKLAGHCYHCVLQQR